jgi:hypothetical protein
MVEERTFTLPGTADGISPDVLTRYAQAFEAHLTVLEKEVVCAAIIAAFKRFDSLESLSFSVGWSSQDKNTDVYSPQADELHTEAGFRLLDDEDAWDMSCALSETFTRAFTARVKDFYDGLTITRQYVIPHDALRFPTLSEMRTAVELDLK